MGNGFDLTDLPWAGGVLFFGAILLAMFWAGWLELREWIRWGKEPAVREDGGLGVVDRKKFIRAIARLGAAGAKRGKNEK